MIKKKLTVGLIIGASVLLAGGCVPGTSNPNTAQPVNTQSINESVEGTVQAQTENQGEYTVKTTAGPVVMVHDGNATLAPYLGQKIKMTGQYSGDTLYVDSIQPLQ